MRPTVPAFKSSKTWASPTAAPKDFKSYEAAEIRAHEDKKGTTFCQPTDQAYRDNFDAIFRKPKTDAPTS